VLAFTWTSLTSKDPCCVQGGIEGENIRLPGAIPGTLPPNGKRGNYKEASVHAKDMQNPQVFKAEAKENLLEDLLDYQFYSQIYPFIFLIHYTNQ
jgi:hypothetical protein